MLYLNTNSNKNNSNNEFTNNFKKQLNSLTKTTSLKGYDVKENQLFKTNEVTKLNENVKNVFTDESKTKTPVLQEARPLWKTILKVGAITVGAMTAAAGGYFLWQFLQKDERPASIELPSRESPTNQTNSHPIHKLAPNPPEIEKTVYLSSKIHDMLNPVSILDSNPISESYQTTNPFLQNRGRLIGLGILTLTPVLFLLSKNLLKNNSEINSFASKKIIAKDNNYSKIINKNITKENIINEPKEINIPPTVTFEKFKDNLSNPAWNVWDDQLWEMETEELRLAIKSSVETAIGSLSKKDEESRKIASHALELLIKVSSSGAYEFANACLKIDSKESSKLIERAFCLFCQFSPPHAYRFALDCLEANSTTSLGIVQKAMEFFLSKGCKPYIFGLANAGYNKKNQEGLSLYQKAFQHYEQHNKNLAEELKKEVMSPEMKALDPGSLEKDLIKKLKEAKNTDLKNVKSIFNELLLKFDLKINEINTNIGIEKNKEVRKINTESVLELYRFCREVVDHLISLDLQHKENFYFTLSFMKKLSRKKYAHIQLSVEKIIFNLLIERDCLNPYLIEWTKDRTIDPKIVSFLSENDKKFNLESLKQDRQKQIKSNIIENVKNENEKNKNESFEFLVTSSSYVSVINNTEKTKDFNEDILKNKMVSSLDKFRELDENAIYEFIKFLKELVAVKKIDIILLKSIFNEAFKKLDAKTNKINSNFNVEIISKFYSSCQSIAEQLIELDMSYKNDFDFTFSFMKKIARKKYSNIKLEIEKAILKSIIDRDNDKLSLTHAFIKKWMNEEKIDAQIICFLCKTLADKNILAVKNFITVFQEKIYEYVKEIDTKTKAAEWNFIIKLMILNKIEFDEIKNNKDFENTCMFIEMLAEKKNIFNSNLVQFADDRIKIPSIKEKLSKLFPPSDDHINSNSEIFDENTSVVDFNRNDIEILESFKKNFIESQVELGINDPKHPLQRVVNYFSKKNHNYKIIADYILKSLKTHPQKAYLFAAACLENTSEIAKQVVKKFLDVFLEQYPRHAYAFTSCCLQIDTEASQEVLINAPCLFFQKNHEEYAFKLLKDCLQANTMRAKMAVEKTCDFLLDHTPENLEPLRQFALECLEMDSAESQKFLRVVFQLFLQKNQMQAFKFAKESLERGDKHSLEHFKNFCKLIDTRFEDLIAGCHNKSSVKEKFKEFSSELIDCVKNYDDSEEDFDMSVLSIGFIKEMISSDNSNFSLEFAKACQGKEDLFFKYIAKDFETYLNDNKAEKAFEFVECVFKTNGEAGKECLDQAFNFIVENRPDLFHDFLNHFLKNSEKEHLKEIDLLLEVHLEFLFDTDEVMAFLFLKEFLNHMSTMDFKFHENVFVNFIKKNEVGVEFLKNCAEHKDFRMNRILISAFKELASSDESEKADALAQKCSSIVELKEYYDEFVHYYALEMEKYFIKKNMKALKSLSENLQTNHESLPSDIANETFKNLLNDQKNALLLLHSCVELNTKVVNGLFITVLKQMILQKELAQGTLSEFREICKEKTDSLSHEIAKLLPSNIKENNDSKIIRLIELNDSSQNNHMSDTKVLAAIKN